MSTLQKMLAGLVIAVTLIGLRCAVYDALLHWDERKRRRLPEPSPPCSIPDCICRRVVYRTHHGGETDATYPCTCGAEPGEPCYPGVAPSHPWPRD